jgi:hypothetical protein
MIAPNRLAVPRPVRHEDFLPLVPVIVRHAAVVFRHLSAADREEAAAEAVAAAFESFIRLKARGRNPARDFPSQMAHFGVLHVNDGRLTGGRASSKDVLSRRAQRRHGFHVESLPTATCTSFERIYTSPLGQEELDAFEERLEDNRLTPIPDQVAFRLDFPAFLRTLTLRDRRLALFLSRGHSGKEAARRFRLSPGRVTQMRKQWRHEWLVFQGEKTDRWKPYARSNVRPVSPTPARRGRRPQASLVR